jgi:hypothetical protein
VGRRNVIGSQRRRLVVGVLVIVASAAAVGTVALGEDDGTHSPDHPATDPSASEDPETVAALEALAERDRNDPNMIAGYDPDSGTVSIDYIEGASPPVGVDTPEEVAQYVFGPGGPPGAKP